MFFCYCQEWENCLYIWMIGFFKSIFCWTRNVCYLDSYQGIKWGSGVMCLTWFVCGTSLILCWQWCCRWFDVNSCVDIIPMSLNHMVKNLWLLIHEVKVMFCWLVLLSRYVSNTNFCCSGCYQQYPYLFSYSTRIEECLRICTTSVMREETPSKV